MAEVLPQQAISPPRKRNHEGQLVHHNRAVDENAMIDSDPSTIATSRQASPAPSTAISELTELTSSIASPKPDSTLTPQTDAASDNSTPAKKRKLTFAEREVEKAVKKREKEEKDKAKAEEKARREEEKRQKDEEKRQKEEEKETARRVKEIEKAEKRKTDDAKKAEREEKKKAKDAEKQEKEAEKVHKEAEKMKKEKAQLRIGNFFGRPAPAATPPTTPGDAPGSVSSRRSSVASIELEEPVVHLSRATHVNPDFEKYIIPYFVHENTDVAPINRFKTARSSALFGGKASDYKIETELSTLEPIQSRFSKLRRKFSPAIPVKQLMESMQPDSEDSGDHKQSAAVLRHVSMKLLSFREDVRPPYVGTFTTPISLESQRKMSRKPTYRGRPDTNYDYDSEAEWEPPAEDDDDINLEDEMSESEDEEDEMQDFLDDEDDTARRKLFIGEMEPVSTGLFWQGETPTPTGFDMEAYRMDVLHDSTSFPIDPFSSIHWSDDTKSKGVQTKSEVKIRDDVKVKIDAIANAMPPPRLPLAPVTAPNSIISYPSASSSHAAANNENSAPIVKQRGRPANSNKELKMISDEFLPAFKQAVNGSDLTKAGLIEILKKQFPKCSKDAIKDTLGVIAVRVGKKEADKKWELV